MEANGGQRRPGHYQYHLIRIWSYFGYHMEWNLLIWGVRPKGAPKYSQRYTVLSSSSQNNKVKIMDWERIITFGSWNMIIIIQRSDPQPFYCHEPVGLCIPVWDLAHRVTQEESNCGLLYKLSPLSKFNGQLSQLIQKVGWMTNQKEREVEQSHRLTEKQTRD